jgi:hypothetical protein
MAKKVASPALQSRMQRAIAMIGRGVNQGKPDMEAEGRRLLAVARVENEIMLGGSFFTKSDIRNLAGVLFDPVNRIEDEDDQEDYTADAVETNAEALARFAVGVKSVPDDAREIAPPLNPTREERIDAMRKGREWEQSRYPQPELLEDPDDIE